MGKRKIDLGNDIVVKRPIEHICTTTQMHRINVELTGTSFDPIARSLVLITPMTNGLGSDITASA